MIRDLSSSYQCMLVHKTVKTVTQLTHIDSL